MDWPKLRAKLHKLFIDQFLLISYFVAALIALTWPTPGKAVLSLDVSRSRAQLAGLGGIRGPQQS